MANLWLSEYASHGMRQRGGVRSDAPALASPVTTSPQTLAISGTSEASNAFHERTRLIRFVSDVDCYVEIGANPTASSGSERVVAGLPEIRAVPTGFKIAVIQSA